MCCFSRPVRHVSQTQIFARDAGSGRQFLVYSMRLELAEELAMILPIPTPPGSPEDAVRFIDLSAYPGFFQDLGRGFSDELLPRAKGRLRAGGAEPQKLRVHDVGEFEASFVPSPRDFERLDERFRLPRQAFDELPEYRDHGFAVFKLRRPRSLLGWLRRLWTMHPMAMEFPRRNARALFFPTVHVHDGQRHQEANFDHSLYCQPGPEIELLLDWERSSEPLGYLMNVRNAAGIIDERASGYRRRLLGRGPNRDVVIDEAELKASVALGELFLLRAGVGPAMPGATAPWPEPAPDARARLKEDLSRALARLTRDRREVWQLTRYRSELPDRWPTLNETFAGDGAPPRDEPCRIKFYAWSQRIAPHEVSLAFRSVPPAELRTAILADLQRVFDEVSGA